ncbi:TIGR00374 family protein, partial [Streptomyces sp. SID486]|uniref:TIGR00374 family protein n=1 Tax=Streptomyces sp. SID486 TaxID=2690264 RepID=UPI001F1FE9B7
MTSLCKPPSPIPPPAVGTVRRTSADVTAVPLPPSPPLSRGRFPRRPARRVPVRRLLCLVPLALVAVAAVRHRSMLTEGFGQLRTASWPWLLAAAGATCLTWVAAAVTRQGAVVQPLPKGRLLATQFAAASANHLLPTGLGAGAVNLRFMSVCGVPPARSTAALALYLLAEAVGRLGLLAALLLAFPDALRLGTVLPDGSPLPLLLGAVCLAAVAGAVPVLVRPLRTRVASFVRDALGEARSVHTRPA